MELQMMMDSAGSETLNGGGGAGSIWLGHSPGSSSPPQPPGPPPYHRLSPNRQDIRGGIVSTQQVSMGFHESTSHGVLWQDKRDSNRNSSPTNDGAAAINANREHSSTIVKHSTNFHQAVTTNSLKRRIGGGDAHHHQQQQQQQHMSELPERKHARRDGSIGSNGSGQAWTSTQVDELAEHLAADFDGPLSALAASDLANAVASYNMSEALLALPSLTVFKQEAPSPEHHATNSNLNHSSQQHPNNVGAGVLGSEADSNNNSTSRNGDICRIGNGNGLGTAIAATTTTTSNVNSPASTSIVSASSVNQQQQQQQHNPGNNNNGGGNRNTGQASLHQLLYSNNEDYQANSSSGNHVSSSQQGNEFNEDSRFQYVLAAATSIATKLNEETLTYLNQGQSYEIKLKKLGDLSAYRGKILKSNIRICFHERRLQYTEREQMMAWQRARPGERLLEVDVPLSYGMVDVLQSLPSKNSVEFMWDPTKEVGVYIKVNCISTEFTPKKHGGEKGVPFRILVETRLPGGARLHAASCQVKVFKLKGADRKHKQDRDKILRRPPHEQDKYQPSYDCTVLSDIPLDSLSPLSNSINHHEGNPFIAPSDAILPQSRNLENGCGGGAASPVPVIGQSSQVVTYMSALESPKEESVDTENMQLLVGTTSCKPVTSGGVVVAGSASIIDSSGLPVSASGVVSAATTTTTTVTTIPRRIVREHASSETCGDSISKDSLFPAEQSAGGDTYQLSADANVTQTNAWLRARRFHSFQATFASFSAQDILRLSRDDLIQICGLADGIRLFNALHSKAPQPKLTLYFAIEGSAVSPWRVIYLDNLNSSHLASKLLATMNLPHDRLHSVLIQGPQGVHVLVSNELVANIKDESMYLVETIKDCASERYKLLLKPSSPR